MGGASSRKQQDGKEFIAAYLYRVWEMSKFLCGLRLCGSKKNDKRE